MKTSQGVKTVLIQQAEAGVRKLLERLQPLEEGDLKGLEQQVLETIFAVGREWMASILSEPTPEERATGQRMGRCGHAQQLEGYRPKQVLTMVGKVTFRRAYYRCVVAEEQAEGSEIGGAEAEADTLKPCTHGEAPVDELWGLHGQRTSAGVRASGELSVCVLDAGRSCRDLESAAPFTDVSAPSPQLDAAAGRSLAAAGR